MCLHAGFLNQGLCCCVYKYSIQIEFNAHMYSSVNAKLFSTSLHPRRPAQYCDLCVQHNQGSTSQALTSVTYSCITSSGFLHYSNLMCSRIRSRKTMPSKAAAAETVHLQHLLCSCCDAEMQLSWSIACQQTAMTTAGCAYAASKEQSAHEVNGVF